MIPSMTLKILNSLVHNSGQEQFSTLGYEDELLELIFPTKEQLQSNSKETATYERIDFSLSWVTCGWNFLNLNFPLGQKAKKPTRDFLSLYGESSFQNEDSTSTSQGFILKTHDFFHPVERITKNSNPKVDTPTSARLLTPEKIVPGKMATYNISHFPNLGIVKHEIKGSTATIGVKSTEKEFDSKERANSYNNHDTGAFTLWLEPSEKDKTPQFPQENPVKLGPWPTESSMPSFISRSSFNCQSSSKQSQKSRSGILEKMKSFKNSQEEKDEEEEYLKKERSFSEENLSFKIDANKSNQKANTPRSKHSATEQRRRSKINERFLMLRELIPHSDQKRDKASFLLEVIQYIQLLQEKVQKYETVYKEKDQENIFMPWKYNQELGDYSNDKPHSNKNGPIHGMPFPVSFDNGNIDLFPSNMTNTKDPLESNMNTSTLYRKGDENSTLPSKMVSPSNLKNSTVIGRCNVIEEHEKRLTSDAENMASHARPQLRKRQGTSGISVNNKGNEAEELMIEGGTVHVSTSYSQGLMSTVAQTLESSGIDLSRASISVQITVGRQKTSRTPTADYGPKKDHGVRVTDSGDPCLPQKKLKIDHS